MRMQILAFLFTGIALVFIGTGVTVNGRSRVIVVLGWLTLAVALLSFYMTVAFIECDVRNACRLFGSE